MELLVVQRLQRNWSAEDASKLLPIAQLAYGFCLHPAHRVLINFYICDGMDESIGSLRMENLSISFRVVELEQLIS